VLCDFNDDLHWYATLLQIEANAALSSSSAGPVLLLGTFILVNSRGQKKLLWNVLLRFSFIANMTVHSVLLVLLNCCSPVRMLHPELDFANQVNAWFGCFTDCFPVASQVLSLVSSFQSVLNHLVFK
jgi:hypothetical protein